MALTGVHGLAFSGECGHTGAVLKAGSTAYNGLFNNPAYPNTPMPDHCYSWILQVESCFTDCEGLVSDDAYLNVLIFRSKS
jgi:hypothetical protein